MTHGIKEHIHPDKRPLPFSQGGTGGRRPEEVRENLKVPGLETDNTFTGINSFSGGAVVNGLSVDGPFGLGGGGLGVPADIVTWVEGENILSISPPRINGRMATAAALVDLEAQTGAIGATTLVADAIGKYLIAAYATVQTADAAATSLTVNAIYTDPQGARTKAVISALATTAAGGDGGSKVVNVASGNLQYSVTLGGVPGGTLDYDLEIDVVPV